MSIRLHVRVKMMRSLFVQTLQALALVLAYNLIFKLNVQDKFDMPVLIYPSTVEIIIFINIKFVIILGQSKS